MEVLGVTASVAGVVGLAGQTIKALFAIHNFFKDAASAHKTIAAFLSSINKLIKLIEDVKSFLEETQDHATYQKPDLRIKGLERQLEDCSENIYRWLKVAQDHRPEQSTGAKACFKRFYIAGNKADVRGTLEEIKQYRSEICASLDVLVKAAAYTRAMKLQQTVVDAADLSIAFRETAMPRMEKIDTMYGYTVKTAESVTSLQSDVGSIKALLDEIVKNMPVNANSSTLTSDEGLAKAMLVLPQPTMTVTLPKKFHSGSSIASDYSVLLKSAFHPSTSTIPAQKVSSGGSIGSEYSSYIQRTFHPSAANAIFNQDNVLSWVPRRESQITLDYLIQSGGKETSVHLTESHYTTSIWDDSNGEGEASRHAEEQPAPGPVNQSATVPGIGSIHPSSDSLYALATRDLLETSLPRYPALVTSYISRSRQLFALEQQFSLLYLLSDVDEAQEYLAKLREQSRLIECSLDRLRVRCIEAGHPLDHIDEVLTSCKMLDPLTGLPLPNNNTTRLRTCDVLGLEQQVLFHEQSFTTRDRINKWLFQNLQTFPENEQLHRSLLPQRAMSEHMDRKMWTRTVLKYWSIDEAATGRDYETIGISTNGVAESVGPDELSEAHEETDSID